MARGSNNKTTSKKRRTKKTPEICITQKIQSPYLKRALDRRKDTPHMKALLDLAVPSHFRNRRFRAKHPEIQFTQEAHLSPFIVHLKEALPQPTELLAHEECYPAQLNFLQGRTPVTQQQEAANDLSLTDADLAGQLAEAPLLLHGWPRWSLPLRLQARPKTVTRNKKAATHIPKTLKSPFSKIKQFSPVAPPKDIFAYFDLPESEQEITDEEELVDLETLTEQVKAARKAIVTEQVVIAKTTRTPRLRLRTFSIPYLTLPQGWHRAIVAFVMVSFAFVLPLHAMNVFQELKETKGQVDTYGENALLALENAADSAASLDGAGAATSFSKASAQFASAQKSINNLGSTTSLILASLPATQTSYQSGQALVDAGENLSVAGQRLSEGLAAIEAEIRPTTTSRLAILSAYIESALPYLETAQESLDDVDLSVVPASKQGTLAELSTHLPTLVQSLQNYMEFSDMMAAVLGANGSKRYLLIFQNNTELRPTGGFMGSFAEIKLRYGDIVEMSIPGGGTYDLQGYMQTSYVAPEPLRLLNARWEFQDANWFADFPTSARNMIDFYKTAGGPTVDGVIAINATYVSELLGLLGPVHMEDYDRTIDQENFLFEAQRIVELEYDKEENQPKAFIGDLAPILLDRMLELSAEEYLNLLTNGNKGLNERDVQLYFTDDTLQKTTIEQGWAGEIKQTDGDYLMVVNTNLGGGKTDGVIAQDVDVTVNVAEDGSITNTVKITKEHHGIQGAIFTGVNNVDYLRVYTPKGSTLLHASGFTIPDGTLFEIPDHDFETNDLLYYLEESREVDPISFTDIFEESGKTVFGNWIQTKPGSSSTVEFTYRLPFTIDELSEPTLFDQVKSWMGISKTLPYTLTVQKQSGVLNRNTTIKLHTPETFNTVWSSHDETEATIDNVTDQLFAALLEQND